MADVRAVNNTLSQAGTSGSLLDRGVFRGKLRVYEDTYEAAALAIGSTIKVGPNKLRPGVRVESVIIFFDALGAATVDVGDTDNPDRYIDGGDVSAIGRIVSNLPDGASYKVIGSDAGTVDDEILITTIAAAITGTIKVQIITSEE